MSAHPARSLALAALVAGSTLVATNASAGNCNSATSVFSDLWAKFAKSATEAGCKAAASNGDVDYKACFDSATKYEKIAADMVKYWNDSAANGWATLGPRRLVFGTTATGTIESVSERLFITETPLDKDTVDLDITKTDGKEEVNLTICKVDKTKSCTTLKEYTFEGGSANTGKTVSYRLTGVKGSIVSVHLAAAKANVRSFSYKIKATKS